MKKIVLLTFILLAGTTSLATVLSVQSEYPVLLLVPSEYTTIQSAINAANTGDTVVVAQDTYYENINFNGKNITLTSTKPNDWSVISETIIDGSGGAGAVVTFAGTETGSCELTGFTITGGYNTGSGGGVQGSGAYAGISRCVITGNITENTGGGVQNFNGDISNCKIIGNSAGISGGGLSGCQGRIANCVISDNTSAKCGGIKNCDGEIVNCTIVNNSGSEGGGLWLCDGSITNCIVWGNSSPEIGTSSVPTYSCFVGGSGTNIDSDPVFFGGGDYHLSAGSPCIDAGDPALDYSGQTDIDGQPRVIGPRVDIGADEITAPAIILENPVGGEVWVSGSTHEIQWTDYTASQTVDFLFSQDGGDNWDVIETSVANTGLYLWQLPDIVDSNNCLIKILPTDEPPVMEYINFDNTFTIHPTNPDIAADSPWPTLGGNSARMGLSDNVGPEEGCVQWQFTTGSPVHNSIAIGPQGRIHITCQDGRIYTLNSDGNELWHFDIGSSVISSPTVGPDGTIYVSCDNDKVYAIDKDANLRWTHNTGDAVYSTPTPGDDGKVFIAGRNGTVYALDQIGSDLWSFELPGVGAVPDSIVAPLAIGIDGSIYAGGIYGSKLYSLNPDTAALNWICDFSHPAEPGNPTQPGLVAAPAVADDGTIYVSLTYDSNLYAINPVDGSILWTAPMEQDGDDSTDGWSEPVIGPDGTIYVSLDNPFVNAVNPNGTIKWTKQLGVIGGFTLTADNNGLIYAACDDGSLYVLNTDGDELSRFDGSQWLSYPVVGPDGVLYVSDSDNAVWAIDSQSCAKSSNGQLNVMAEDTLDLHRPADITAEGAVNFDDLIVLAEQWLHCSDTNPQADCNYNGDTIYIPADINRDQHVNFNDLALLAAGWLDNN